VMLRSRRQGAGWQPRVRLRDWMELPRPGDGLPARATVDGADALNRRFNRWAPVAAASAITWLTLFMIWMGSVFVPSAARRLRTTAAGPDGGARRLGTVIAMRDRARHVLSEVGSAPQMDWLGGIGTMSPHLDGGLDDDGNERDRRHRLAS
jgi:hypothetical protein